MLLDIITISKDDTVGLKATIVSTRFLRRNFSVRQLIIDSSSQQIHYNEKNLQQFFQLPQGISAAFNLGLSHARAEWVWFLNGGDRTYPRLNFNLLMNLLKTTSADMLIFELAYSDGVVHRPPFFALWPPTLNWIPHPAVIFKRDLFSKYGTFRPDLKVAMDYELWFRLLSRDIRVDLVSFPLAKFADNGLSRNKSLVNPEARKIMLQYAPLLFKRWLNQAYLIFKAWSFYGRK